MIKISESDWIDAHHQRPAVWQRVLACNLFPSETPKIHMVTYTGQSQKEWQNDFIDVRTADYSQFTHWLPLDIEPPEDTTFKAIQAFQQELGSIQPGQSIKVSVNPSLSEQYVKTQVMAKAQIEQWGVRENRNNHPEIIYTFDEN